MKKLKFLIADDEEMIQDLYEMVIESEYICETIKVGNGKDAISALTEIKDFDFIISDYKMPLATGGDVYNFNKANQNRPFFLFSGGELRDYVEFLDFKASNERNSFFGKPFDDKELLDAILKLDLEKDAIESAGLQYIKVKLSYFAKHATSAGVVFLKLNDNKFTKIINTNPENMPDADLILHYQNKGVEFIYLERAYFKVFLDEVFNEFEKSILREKKPETFFKIAGFNFKTSVEGLNDIGVSLAQIEKVNDAIEDTVSALLNNPGAKSQFKKLCESDGFIIGHSTLIMYIAGVICKNSNLSFYTTMKKICGAAFYHDYSIFDLDFELDEMKLKDIKEPHLLKLINDHPSSSSNYLPENFEVVDDTKKIILEHHELPNGDGYPRKLNSQQIAPLSCLFIIAQQITFCLIRNNFSRDHLKAFLINAEKDFNQGNFATFYTIAKNSF
jgi:HD-GYP domain-containing protein (c-di-GMP phosphodiesterase class II)